MMIAVTIVLYIATSKDGFIADEKGGLDWLPQTLEQTGGQDYGYQKFYDTIDAIAIGRKTYEQILEFGPWPYPGKKSYIFSSKPEVSTNSDIEFVTEDIPTFLKKLNAKRLWLAGGAGLVDSFYKHGKIDEYIVTIFPVTLGKGIPLKSVQEALQKGEIVKQDVIEYGDGVIQEIYVPSGKK